MIKSALLLLQFSLTVSALAKSCPQSWQNIVPCSCDEYTLTITCAKIVGAWDIKETFNRISQYVPESTVFNELIVTYTEVTEMPADTFGHLKFKKITIEINHNLTYISPAAFNASFDVTTQLSLHFNRLRNEAPRERDIFNLLNHFIEIDYINLSNNQLTSVPDYAFESLPKLRILNLEANKIADIGDHAFSALSFIKILYLGSNKITGQRLHPNAFTGVSADVEVSLIRNGLVIFEEEYFRTMVEDVKLVKLVYSFCSRGGCSYGDYMTCDSNASWLCEDSVKFEPKVKSFFCSHGKTVWDYCESLEGEKL